MHAIAIVNRTYWGVKSGNMALLAGIVSVVPRVGTGGLRGLLLFLTDTRLPSDSGALSRPRTFVSFRRICSTFFRSLESDLDGDSFF